MSSGAAVAWTFFLVLVLTLALTFLWMLSHVPMLCASW